MELYLRIGGKYPRRGSIFVSLGERCYPYRLWAKYFNTLVIVRFIYIIDPFFVQQYSNPAVSLSIECSLWLLVASLVGTRLCRWCIVPLTSTLVLIFPTLEGWQAESTSWCILIQRPTGLELRTLGSQAATITTKPTPGLVWGICHSESLKEGSPALPFSQHKMGVQVYY